jgi:hypothetical protein
MGQMLQPKLEYLLTMHAALDPPQAIDAATMIFNVKGGWAEGPGINGKIVPPAADWLRILPSGTWRIDVRGTLVTDDEQLIYTTYNGVIQHSPESLAKMQSGSLITPSDGIYFAIAPTFQTSSEKYGWLNGVQAVGQIVQACTDPNNSFVRYEVFVVR